MNIKASSLLAITLLLAAGAMAQSWPTPQAEAKPGARWWWMGSAVSKPDLEWNMTEYGKAGIGALEVTPIYGVVGNEAQELQYLSAPWMDAFKYAQAKGQHDGILIDMNLGTGWPFGGPEITIDDAASKLVYVDLTATGQELRSGINISVREEKEKPYAKLSRVMAYVVKDGKVSSSTSLLSLKDKGEVVLSDDGTLTWKKAQKKQTYRILAIYCSKTRQKVKRAAPGGEGYVMDHFDKDVVRKYFDKYDAAFEKYGARDKDGNIVWPHTLFNDSYEVYGADWTPTLFEEFEKRRGYKLEDHMLELLGLIEDEDEQTLVDYRETLGELLLENFTEQWTEWAHSHGAKTRNQAHGSPANLIDVYSAVDIPEIEGFGLSELGIKGLRQDPGNTRKNDSDVSMFKYASSAAHINGKPLVSSETFTWLTEHFRTSLSQCKPDLDLMFTCGINNVYFHGTTFSPKDDPWPGYKFYASIDMSPTNSIWHDAPYFFKYIERCQSFLQMGEPDNDFLVYLPIRDMLAQRTKSLIMQFSIHDMKKLAPDFIKSILSIDAAGFDCDYISDKYLLGTIFEGGLLKTAAGTRYKALIIPSHSGRITEAVKSHIESLKAQGAIIIEGTDATQLAGAAAAEPLRLIKGVRALRRKNPTGYHYFIANLSPEDVMKRVKLTVGMKDARWFDPMTGGIYSVDANDDGVLLNLRSGQSLILQTYDAPLSETCVGAPSVGAKGDHSWSPLQGRPEPAPLPALNPQVEKAIEGPWTLSFVESAPRVDATFTLPSLQTWETLDDDSAKITMGTGAYTTTLSLTADEASRTWAIELGDVRESARVYVNGELIGCAWAAPFSLSLGQTLKEGDNEIRIEVTNLPANRIADLDRKKVGWRKFKDTNVVNINYKKVDYADWSPVPSGLNSNVKLVMSEE